MSPEDRPPVKTPNMEIKRCPRCGAVKLHDLEWKIPPPCFTPRQGISVLYSMCPDCADSPAGLRAVGFKGVIVLGPAGETSKTNRAMRPYWRMETQRWDFLPEVHYPEVVYDLGSGEFLIIPEPNKFRWYNQLRPAILRPQTKPENT